MASLNRRTVVIGLCSTAVVPTSVRAQPTERVYRVGYLSPGSGPGGSRPLLDFLIAALRERGWIVDRNLIIEIRDTLGDPVRAEALAKELVQARADLIVTVATGTAMAAHRATTVVPIVMYTSGVPVEGGLAKSLARPGGNVTGMTIYAGGFGLWGKYLQLLRELVPSLRDLGVLWGYAPPSYRMEQVAPATDELRRAANALNVNARFWQTGRESDLQSALTAAERARLDALLVTSGIIHSLPDITSRIARFVRQRRLPALTDAIGYVFDECAVLAYSPQWSELATRTANFVDRILKGANPAELPIEQPTKYDLVVNLKTARAIGLTIPQSMLLRADRILE